MGFRELAMGAGMLEAQPDTSSINFLEKMGSRKAACPHHLTSSAQPLQAFIFSLISTLTDVRHLNAHYNGPHIPRPTAQTPFVTKELRAGGGVFGSNFTS